MFRATISPIFKRVLDCAPPEGLPYLITDRQRIGYNIPQAVFQV